MKLYHATDDVLGRIERVMRRLYADMKPMNADDMRDNAQVLDGALQEIRECGVEDAGVVLTEEEMQAQTKLADAAFHEERQRHE